MLWLSLEINSYLFFNRVFKCVLFKISLVQTVLPCFVLKTCADKQHNTKQLKERDLRQQTTGKKRSDWGPYILSKFLKGNSSFRKCISKGRPRIFSSLAQKYVLH